MSETPQSLDLAADFAPASLEAWQRVIEKELKGKAWSQYMEPPLPDGGTTQAAQTRENAPLGRQAPPKEQVGWQISQALVLDSQHAKALNAALLAQLEHGLEAITLRLPYNQLFDSASLNRQHIGDLLDQVLQGVFPNYIDIRFYVGAHSPLVATAFADWLSKNGHDAVQQSGTFIWDPIALAAWSGWLPSDAHTQLQAFQQQLYGILPKMEVCSTNAYYYAACGANPVQEVAYALTSVFAQLGSPMSCVPLRLGVGADFFSELAKFRAVRSLWQQLAPTYANKYADKPLQLIATTSQWNLATTDPYNNLVRTTLQAMSAVMGGVDVLEVQPYNVRSASFDSAAMRWAKNIQLLLKEESFLVRVKDPAGGAYVVESLTAGIVEAAKKRISSIMSQGGLMQHLRTGQLQLEVQTVADRLKDTIASQQRVWVGVNKYVTSEQQAAAAPFVPSVGETNLPATIHPLNL